MTDEPIRVVFHLDPQRHLIGVIRSAVEFQALQCGLGAETSAEFAKASEDVCRESISQIAEPGGLEVTLDTFHDRIEISIHHHGQLAPPVGLECFALSEVSADETHRFNGLELLSRVDRVLFNAQNGMALTTLVKYLHHHKR